MFGRLADKILLFDVPGAGTPAMKDCCHGGCDNCAFTRVFDEMRSGRPKWIAHYTFLEHMDGRSHRPSWVTQLFEDDITRGLSEPEFVSKLQSISYSTPLGPQKSFSEPPSNEASFELFRRLSGGKGSLNAVDMASALQSLTGVPHGSTWKEFRAGFE